MTSQINTLKKADPCYQANYQEILVIFISLPYHTNFNYDGVLLQKQSFLILFELCFTYALYYRTQSQLCGFISKMRATNTQLLPYSVLI